MIKPRVMDHGYLLVTKDQRSALNSLRRNSKNDFELSTLILEDWEKWKNKDDPENIYNFLGQIDIKHLIPAAINNMYTSHADVTDLIYYMIEDASSLNESAILKKILHLLELYEIDQ